MRTLPSQLISLIHYVELSNAGWWESTIDRCTIATLWAIKSPVPPVRIRKEIDKQLNLNVKAAELEESLKRLTSTGEVVALRDSKFKLAVETEGSLDRQVAESKELEETVKAKFAEKLEGASPSQNASFLWGLFTEKFLIPMVTDAGARMYEFFVTKPPQTKWVSYAEDFLKHIPDDCREVVSLAVFEFLNPQDPSIARFMLTYLDAYFVVTASGLSSKAVSRLAEIRKTPLEFVIFVDTNFVFSILGLHSNPLNETANDLMDLVESVSGEVNVSFVISPITLEETTTAIRRYRRQLGDAPYSPNLAKAGANAEVSGIVATFFERVKEADRPISPSEYFEPYETGLTRILEEKGVSVFLEGDYARYKNDKDVRADISNQLVYEEDKYKDRAKSEYQIENDVLLWYFVRDSRDPKVALPLEAKFWIVTVDYHFLIFDRYKTSKTSRPPVCMLPAQFIQVLRFFAPRPPEFERMMMSTLRVPLISRQFDSKAERITIRILSQLARFEGIADLSANAISGVLTDNTLRERLTGIKSEKSSEETAAVESTLANQLAEYKQKVETVEQKRTEEQREAARKLEEASRIADERISAAKEGAARDVVRLSAQVDDLTQQASASKAANVDLTNQLRELQAQVNRREEREAKSKAIRSYSILCVVLILPYPVVFALLWMFLLSHIAIPWLAYTIAIALTTACAYVLLQVLLRQGAKDKYVSEVDLFVRVASSLRLTTIAIFLITASWLALSSVIHEAVKRWILGP